MSFFPSQLSLLLIPGIATYFAVSTLQGGRAMERRPSMSYVRWLRTSAIVLNSMGLLGVASLFVGYISLLIILPALSLILTIWMMRRRRAQLRFAWGMLLAGSHGLPTEPLAAAISESSPWWTRRQLREAVKKLQRGGSGVQAIQSTGIPLPIEMGLALSDRSAATIEPNQLLQRFEDLTANRQKYREFIRLWNYFMAIGFMLIAFLQFVSPSLAKLVREMELVRRSGFQTPSQFLESYGLSSLPVFAFSVFACLFLVVLSLILNLDQLELWPRNWWPSTALHRGWFRAVTLEHACREVAAGRSWTDVYQTLAVEHPLHGLRKACGRIHEGLANSNVGVVLHRNGWIAKDVEHRLSSENLLPQTEATVLRNTALRQQTMVADGWRKTTDRLRWTGTLICGFFVGWIALSYFDLFVELIRQLS